MTTIPRKFRASAGLLTGTQVFEGIQFDGPVSAVGIQLWLGPGMVEYVLDEYEEITHLIIDTPRGREVANLYDWVTLDINGDPDITPSRVFHQAYRLID